MTETMSLSLKYNWKNGWRHSKGLQNGLGGRFASNPEICGYGEEITREIEDAKKEVDTIEKLLVRSHFGSSHFG